MERRVLEELKQVVGPTGLLNAPEQLRTYESDGLVSYRSAPAALVLPTSTAMVQGVIRVCHREQIPFVARGSGTGLSGGALPLEDGLLISLARMNRVLSVDIRN